MKITIASVCLCLLLASCQPENRVFIEHQALSPNVEWLQKDARTFEVNITDTEAVYDFNLTYRYAQGYPYQIAKVKLQEITPSGKETTTQHDLLVRKENGDYIGEAGYDIWDSTHPIFGKKKFTETGTYVYTLTHDMPKDPLPYAMEIGIVLDKVE